MTPGDEIIWFKTTPGKPYQCQKIPGVLKRILPKKYEIELVDKTGAKVTRFVMQYQVEKR